MIHAEEHALGMQDTANPITKKVNLLIIILNNYKFCYNMENVEWGSESDGKAKLFNIFIIER